MNNQVNLTDNELSAIQTALQVMLLSIKTYEKDNALDILTKETKEEMQKLYDRLNKEYF